MTSLILTVDGAQCSEIVEALCTVLEQQMNHAGLKCTLDRIETADVRGIQLDRRDFH